MGYAVVIVSRDEAVNIGRCVKGVLGQVPAPLRVVVVDDGSVDGTGGIAESLGVNVIRLRSHRDSYAGRPELAYRWNVGFLNVMECNPEYIVMLGADHVLDPGYVSAIISGMGPDAVVSCAEYSNEASSGNPGGSGRVIRVKWFRRYGCVFPVEYGWESWMIYRARMDGFKADVNHGVKTTLSRPISKGAVKMMYWGRGSWCLGASFPYMVHRCAGTLRVVGWKAALSMMAGFLYHPGCRRLDVSGYVSGNHRRVLSGKIRSVFQGLCFKPVLQFS